MTQKSGTQCDGCCRCHTISLETRHIVCIRSTAGSPKPLFCCVFRVLAQVANFGSYVTHETKNFIYFYLGQVAILLFKSG